MYPGCTRTSPTCARPAPNLVAGLTRLGFRVLPSAANFVFAESPALPAAEVYAKLR